MQTENLVPGLPRHIVGLAELAGSYDVILCDVWGVIHNGVAHHPGAVDALIRFRQQGGVVVLITNAPSPQATVRRRLDALDVPHAAYDAIVTSGDVTISLILERGDIPLFHLGLANDRPIYREIEAVRGKTPRLTGLDEAELVVCTGLLDTLEDNPAGHDKLLAKARERGLDLICANPDIVVQVGSDLVYCAGAVAERYAQIGGTVIHAGKPYPRIYARALGLAKPLLSGPLELGRLLAIGDAMRTDVRGAHNQSIASLFVSSGIHRDDLHGRVPNAALDEAAFRQFLATAGFAPTAVLSDLVW